MRLPHVVSVTRAPLVSDGKGGVFPDWPNAVTSSTPAAWVQPVSSDEQSLNEDRVVARWKIFLPPAVDLLPTDRLVWDGETYQVDGEVQLWDVGRPHHHEAFLLRVIGG